MCLPAGEDQSFPSGGRASRTTTLTFFAAGESGLANADVKDGDDGGGLVVGDGGERR